MRSLCRPCRRGGSVATARRCLIGGSYAGYEPGYEAAPWLDGAAKLIRAGSDVVFDAL
jgi:hypothetical protein